MRAAAAYSTAIKNTSDIRHTMRVDASDAGVQELPELIIRELTSEEIESVSIALEPEAEAV